jgi:formylglycine-generating enzyme required for sulfatase activity
MKTTTILFTLWLLLTAIYVADTTTEPKPDDGFILVEGTKKGQDYPFRRENIPVPIKPFYIAPTEVTYAQIALYCYDNGLDPKTFHHAGWGAEEANRAAVQVNWYDAIRYCNWLSEQTGYMNLAYDIYAEIDGVSRIITPKDSIYWKETKYGEVFWDSIVYDITSKAYRLPTEAEWEYAASSYSKLGKNPPSTRGKQLYAGTDSLNELQNYAWYGENSSSRAQKVKTKEPNRLGIYDMSGNVWEWCFDAYDAEKPFEKLAYMGEVSTSRRLRGGSWYSSASSCEVQYRFYIGPDDSSYGGGFRLTRTR